MKDLTIFSITIFIILIFQTSCLLFKVTGEKKEYCFGKIINEDDIISLTYVVSSESEENIKVSLIRLFNNEIIYEDNSTESGSYRSEQGEDGERAADCQRDTEVDDSQDLPSFPRAQGHRHGRSNHTGQGGRR